MGELIQAFQKTPLPTILVVAGIFFLFMSVAGGLSGKINVPPNRQKFAALLGVLLLVVGIAMHVSPEAPVPPDAARQKSETPAPATTDKSRTIVRGERVGERQYTEWPEIANVAFVTNRDNWATGTFDDESLKQKIQVVGGKYRWEATFMQNTSRRILSPYEPAMNFYAAVDLRLQPGLPDRVSGGIVFRLNGKQFYRFYLHSGRYFALYYYDGEKYHDLIGWTYIPNINPLETNRLAVLADGPEIELFINGRMFGEVQDESLTTGNVGFFIEGGEVTGKTNLYDFDNFEYRRKP